MTKVENFQKTVTLNKDNKTVSVMITYDESRYYGEVYGGCRDICIETMNEIKEECPIHTSSRGDYSILKNTDISPEEFTGKTLEEDRKIFQKYLNRNYGKNKYKAFVLGAYIHSGTSFSISQEGDHRCRWDSSQLGFIGLPIKGKKSKEFFRDTNANEIAQLMTDAWEGNFFNLRVLDSANNDEIVTEILDSDYQSLQKFKTEALEKYGVNFDEIEPIYD